MITKFQFANRAACAAARGAGGAAGVECPRGASARSGFSLVEISMVLLLFASAVGGLLSFFPVGLRLESNAISDSAQTMFALNVLAQVEAKAAELDWSVWNGTTKRFAEEVFSDVKVNDGKSLRHSFDTRNYEKWSDTDYDEEVCRTSDDGTLIDNYLTSRSAIRYIIQVSPVETPIYFGKNASSYDRNGKTVKGSDGKVMHPGYKMRKVSIWVTDRRDGDPFANTPFTLDLVYEPKIDKIVNQGKAKDAI